MSSAYLSKAEAIIESIDIVSINSYSFSLFWAIVEKDSRTSVFKLTLVAAVKIASSKFLSVSIFVLGGSKSSALIFLPT